MAKPNILSRIVTEVRSFIGGREKALADFSFDTQNLGSFVAWLKKANKMSVTQYMEAYEEVGYVNMCVRAIAEAVGKIEFTVGMKKAGGEVNLLNQHPVLDLLANPGNQQTAFSLMELTQTYLELTGTSYWFIEYGLISGKPKSILPLRPDRMQVVINEDDETIKGFVHHSDNGTETPLDLNEVVYIHMPNPLKPWKGIGTIQAAQAYVDTEKYTTDWSKNYMYNNGSPSGIVNIKSNLNASEFEQIKRKWAAEYGGVDNAGKVAFLKNMDASFVQIGSSMGDIALKDLKGQSLADIMATFRVSKPILGIFEDVNLASAKTAFYVFHKVVVDPKMHRIVDALQAQLMPFYKDSCCIGYVSPVTEDQDEKLAYYEAGWGKWLTPNDVRTAEGMEEIEGGDDILVPMNLVPLEADPAENEDNEDDDGGQGGNNEPMDGGDMPDPEDMEGDGDDPSDPQGGGGEKALTVKVRLKKKIKKYALSAEAKETYRLNLFKIAGKYEKKIKKVLVDQFKRMRKEALQHVATHFKDISDYGIDPDYEGEEMLSGVSPVMLDMMMQQGGASMGLIGQGEEFKLTPQMEKYVNDRVKLFTDPMLVELSDSIAGAITEGMSQGLGADGIGKLVGNVFDDYQGARADRIARTEASAASNEAAVESYRQSDYVTGMEWYANPDACDDCQSLDGTVVSIDDNFADIGTSVGNIDITYSDVGAPPLHPNCECTVLPAIIS